MANFTTAIAEENEIIKAEDVSFGYEAAVNNVALALQGVLGSTSGSYVIGGSVTPYPAGGLNVMIEPIYAYCSSTGVAVVETDATGPIPLEEEEYAERIDIIQVQGLEEGYDYQVRMFNDPGSGTKTSESLNTKKRVKLSYGVKKGTPGGGSAPSADTGWVKLAEVHIIGGNNVIDASQIFNITAREYGTPNEGWTADTAAAYNPGALSQSLNTFLIAHNEDGSHKEKVIDEDDINWGTGNSQVNAKQMPIGDSARIYGGGKTETYTSSQAVQELLIGLVERINSLYPYANNLLSRYEFANVSPVAASTANVSSLSGAMTIDGVTVSEGQAVLLKDQENSTENGIWRVSGTGAWTRYEGYAASDREPLTHKLIVVSGGTENGGKVFYLAGDTYTIGTDELEFQESCLSPHEAAHKVIVRDSDGKISGLTATGVVTGGQIVLPSSQPSSLVNGSIWLTS